MWRVLWSFESGKIFRLAAQPNLLAYSIILGQSKFQYPDCRLLFGVVRPCGHRVYTCHSSRAWRVSQNGYQLGWCPLAVRNLSLICSVLVSLNLFFLPVTPLWMELWDPNLFRKNVLVSILLSREVNHYRKISNRQSLDYHTGRFTARLPPLCVNGKTLHDWTPPIQHCRILSWKYLSSEWIKFDWIQIQCYADHFSRHNSSPSNVITRFESHLAHMELKKLSISQIAPAKAQGGPRR